jgi:hypothetical protein
MGTRQNVGSFFTGCPPIDNLEGGRIAPKRETGGVRI